MATRVEMVKRTEHHLASVYVVRHGSAECSTERNTEHKQEKVLCIVRGAIATLDRSVVPAHGNARSVSEPRLRNSCVNEDIWK